MKNDHIYRKPKVEGQVRVSTKGSVVIGKISEVAPTYLVVDTKGGRVVRSLSAITRVVPEIG